MKAKILLAMALVYGLVPATAAAQATAFQGTVVKREVATRTVVVATGSGRLVIVHGTRARVGSILRVSGTHVRVVGHTRHARIEGLVISLGLRSFSVSAGGAVVSIRAHRHVRHTVGTGLSVHATITAGGTVTEESSSSSEDVSGASGTLPLTGAAMIRFVLIGGALVIGGCVLRHTGRPDQS
jgi:hypothetical protein